jgi:hypothetical protein
MFFFRILVVALVTVLAGCASLREFAGMHEKPPAPKVALAPAPAPRPAQPAAPAIAFITPANPLETALVAMARDPSDTHKGAFTSTFLTSTVYLRTTKEGAASTNGGQITFWRAPTPTGESAMVLFTSDARLRQAFPQDAQVDWLAMTGREALNAGRNLPVILNWGLQPPAIWSAAQSERLRTSP